MNYLLILAFLFFIGCTLGWVLELFFRHFYLRFNGEKKWVNPGFLNGPYLPIYGFGLCVLYLLAGFERYAFLDNFILNKLLLFFIMALCMTALEYVAGIIFIKRMKVKLWDYSAMPGNIQGIICPLYSFFWAILGAMYYFLIHPHILNALEWLSNNLAFSFFIGMFFGIFTIDVAISMNLAVKLRRFANENNIVFMYEEFKENIKRSATRRKRKIEFIFALYSESQLAEPFKDYLEKHKDFQTRIKKPFRKN